MIELISVITFCFAVVVIARREAILRGRVLELERRVAVESRPIPSRPADVKSEEFVRRKFL